MNIRTSTPSKEREEEEKIRNSMSDIEYEIFCIKRKCDLQNEIKGDLKYYDCPKCLNRGFINTYKVDGKKVYMQTRQCDCKKIRDVYYNLNSCGVSKDMLDKCTLDNFEAKDKWQEIVKQKAMAYLNNPTTWFFISAISGSGKTHICTAIFQELIKRGLNGTYMLWVEELPQLKALKKSSFSDNQDKFANIMYKLKTVDVLYIDDFLKFIDNNSRAEDLNIAYEIINTRYNNNLLTIFSSENKKSEIKELDVATYGRIVEKTNEYWIELLYEDNRNYRLYGGRK